MVSPSTRKSHGYAQGSIELKDKSLYYEYFGTQILNNFRFLKSEIIISPMKQNVVQGVLALCEFHYCEFHYCGFSNHSIDICLMQLFGY